MLATVSTRPSASGSPVIFNTSHAPAIPVNWSPSREVHWPIHRSRKSRMPNTRFIGLEAGSTVMEVIGVSFQYDTIR
jgi:hypothetical protein